MRSALLFREYPDRQISFGDQKRELREMVYHGTEAPDHYIRGLFDKVMFPEYSLKGLRNLVHELENLSDEITAREEIQTLSEAGKEVNWRPSANSM